VPHRPLWTSALVLLTSLSSSTSLADVQEIKLNIQHSINSVTLRGEVDFRQEGGRLFRKHYDAGIRLPVSLLGDGWSFGMHYRAVYSPAKNGGWNLEKRPYAQLQKTFKTNENSWLPSSKWAIRTRQESRFRQNKDNSRRNRVRLYAKSLTPLWGALPFIANEYFYDFRKDEVTKVRFDVGFEFPKIAGMKPSLYYKHTNTYKKRDWIPYSAVVLRLSF